MDKKRLIITSIIIFLAAFLTIFFTTLTGFKSVESGIIASTGNSTNSLVVSLNTGSTERDALATYGVNKDTYLSFYYKDSDDPYLTNISVVEEKTFAALKANQNQLIIYDSTDIGAKVCEGFVYATGVHAYVRFDVVVPVTYYTSLNFLIYGTTIVVLATAGGIAIFWIVYKKSLLPLKAQIRKLRSIVSVDHNVQYNDDFSYLALMIRDSRRELENQLELTRTGEQKINFVLDSISQGLIVLDASYKIIMINKTACEIFQVEKKAVEQSNMDGIKPSRAFEINASMVVQTQKSFVYTEKIRGRVYRCNINPIDYSWTRVNEKNGASVLLIDVTDEYNSSRMKREFFDNASHELKSPLTSILGYQQMIKAGIITNKEDVDNAIEKSIKECHRMNKIIIDMLSLSSLENEDLRSVEDLDVEKGIRSIVESLEPQMKKKSIQMKLEPFSFSLKINPEDFEKLIRNLLDNAIKYNKDHGHIWVSYNPEAKALSIKDDGVGISEENLNRIFERFFRVDKARSKDSGGTGLGLAIVKHICNYYDYRIEVKSQLGQGTEFVISF